MTEATPPEGSAPTELLVEDIGADEILQAMVATVDDSDSASVGVTLTVNGSLVSGTLIGAKRWFKELEMQYAELREGYTTPLRRQYVDGYGEGETDPDDVVFIHLKEARYLTGAGHVPNLRATGFFWRGRISHVSAWSFGVVGGNQV